MNIFHKSIIKQSLGHELKKTKKNAMMVNFNTLQIKQFSNRREVSSLISNKSNFVFLFNYQTSTKFSFYSIKKNNFAESKITNDYF